MTTKESVFIINWYGPHPLDEAPEDSNVLYAAVGGTATDRNRKFRYCGITDIYFKFRSRQHHKLKEVEECKLWLGWFAFPNPRKAPRVHLELAEWIIVYYWNDILNLRKVSTPPRASGIVVSRWFTPAWEAGKKPAPFRELPDMIGWNAEEKRWRTGDFSKDYADDDWKTA